MAVSTGGRRDSQVEILGAGARRDGGDRGPGRSCARALWSRSFHGPPRAWLATERRLLRNCRIWHTPTGIRNGAVAGGDAARPGVLRKLTVREYPKIDEPVVTVRTTYRGASPEIVESQVTKPLEDSLAGIEGVDVLSSDQPPGRSADIDGSGSSVTPTRAAAGRDRVSRVRQRLPGDIDEPVIAKVEADASPIIYLAFSSDRHSPLEVTDVATRIVEATTPDLPGPPTCVRCSATASTRCGSGRPHPAGRLRPDHPGRRGCAAPAEREIPAGLIESSKREFAVVARTDLTWSRSSQTWWCAVPWFRTATRCASGRRPRRGGRGIGAYLGALLLASRRWRWG